MLKQKLQYFGHLMQRTDAVEGKIEGRRRRGQQRMRWLGGITSWPAGPVGSGIVTPGGLTGLSPQIQHDTDSTVSPTICHEVMGPVVTNGSSVPDCRGDCASVSPPAQVKGAKEGKLELAYQILPCLPNPSSAEISDHPQDSRQVGLLPACTLSQRIG